MRVNIVTGGADVGGARAHLRGLMQAIDRNRFDLSLTCFQDGPVAADGRGLGVPVYVVSSYRPTSLRALLRQVKPDIVHTHGARANLLGRWAAHAERVPHIITTVHSLIDFEHEKAWKNDLLARLEQLTLPYCQRLIVVSHGLARKLVERGYSDERMEVIHNGIDLAPYNLSRAEARAAMEERYGSEGPFVGSAGRLVSVKGYDILIEAFAHVVDKFPQAKLVIAGEGPLRGYLQQLAERLPPGTVQFPGFETGMPTWLSGLDLFVMSSRMEGLPMVALEAMAAGTPVVAHAVGGLPEVISDEDYGWLVRPPGVATLGPAMRLALESPEKLAQKAAAAREMVRQEFSLEQMVRRTEAVYEQVVEGVN